jgi:hypothetical protein
MTTTAAVPAARPRKIDATAFPKPDEGATVLGEVVSWELDAVRVRYTHLRDALAASGLDPAVAREMLPRNAFARAARKLQERRIIRQVEDLDDVVRFQFTAEHRPGGLFTYELETVLTLDKATGAIACDDPGLADQARAAFDEEVAHRGTSDVTAIIKRLFADRKDARLDLIPINSRGTYFVRRDCLDHVDRIEAFVGRLNGYLTRLPIASGTARGDRSV